MVTVETICRVQHAFHVKGKAIKQISRELRLSRNTVRSIVRGDETARSYERRAQPLPKLGAFADDLDRMLEHNARRPRRERLTFLRLYEELRLSGYQGGYDAVRRYGRAWERRQAALQTDAFVPLVFAPGEAYQFDWSHEVVVMDGVTTVVKVAHVRLSTAACCSYVPIRAKPRRWSSTPTRRRSASSGAPASAASTTT